MLKRWFGSRFTSWFSPSESKSSFSTYIAVIIGACNPIGEAIAFKCVTDECINVAIVDMEQNEKSLLSLQNKLKSQSSFDNVKIEAFYMKHFKDTNQIHNLISNIKTRFNTNSIQFLFNNIDCLMDISLRNNTKNTIDNKSDIPSILTSKLSNHNNEKMQEMMDFNFWSVLHLTKAFLPLLLSKENIETNKKCFIINTSSLKSAAMHDSMYSVTKYCMHALCEVTKYEIDVILDSIKNSTFDLKLKILCPGFVEKNDEYNLVNISHKYDALESTENMKKVIHKIEIPVNEFGKIIFDGIRNDNIFIIQSHPKIFRVYSADKLIAIADETEKRHIYTKKFLKSVISKL